MVFDLNRDYFLRISLYQIFRCLHPRDLLNLARTSKPFRALLMNKKDAGACWTAARLQAEDIPPIPPHLDEPAYASLLYSLHCHVSSVVLSDFFSF